MKYEIGVIISAKATFIDNDYFYGCRVEVNDAYGKCNIVLLKDETNTEDAEDQVLGMNLLDA